MMGSPFYYDVLFDDGPGDVVFHDCMWSGICTCCIQLLHQDYYIIESPDLKASNQQQYQYQQSLQQQQHQQSSHCSNHSATSTSINNQLNNNTNTINNNTNYQSSNLNNYHSSSPDQQHHQNSLSATTTTTCTSLNKDSVLSATNNLTTSNKVTTIQNHQHHHQNHLNHLHQLEHSNTSNTSSTNSNCSISPDQLNRHHQNLSSPSTSISPDLASSSTLSSPKPVRRREHNDSERKRRDHLRNAFNFLRDQVPRFKAINKKPPRIQILHEATQYVQRIMKESMELERRLEEERIKHEKLQKLQN